ncbi:MAG TPA: hypothetical protein VIY48_04095, partial [Candidatus Paceibacterota bacterium]
ILSWVYFDPGTTLLWRRCPTTFMSRVKLDTLNIYSGTTFVSRVKLDTLNIYSGTTFVSRVKLDTLNIC